MTRAVADAPSWLSPPTEPRALRALYLIFAVGCAAGFLCFALTFNVPANGGVDQNGYLVGGRMILKNGGSMRQTPTDPFQHVGAMWVGVDLGTPRERYYPKYPPGLPMLAAFMFKHHGPASAYLISPVAMTLAVFGTFLLVRAVAGSFLGLLGMLAFATAAPTLILANNPNSHAPAACLVVLGMYLLIRWAQSGGAIRAIFAGLFLGLATTIRYSEGLLALPIAAAVLLTLRLRDRRRVLEAGLMIAWWGIVVLALASYNLRELGTLTGYDETNESSGFSWTYFVSDGLHAGNWETLLRHFNELGLPLLFPLAIVGLICLVAWNIRLAALIGAWVLSTTVIYAIYYFAPDGHPTAYLRFFFTAFPGIILLALWPLAQLRAAGRGRLVAPIIAIIVVSLSAMLSVRTARPQIEADQMRDLCLHEIARHSEGLPRRSVVLADDRICNYLQFVADFILYDPAQAFSESAIRSALKESESDEPQIVQTARAQATADRLGDNLKQKELTRLLHRTLDDALSDGRRVFVIANLHPKRKLADSVLQLLPGTTAKELAELYTVNVIDRWNDPNAAGPKIADIPRRRAKRLEQATAPDPNQSAWGVVELTRRGASTRPSTQPTTQPK